VVHSFRWRLTLAYAVALWFALAALLILLAPNVIAHTGSPNAADIEQTATDVRLLALRYAFPPTTIATLLNTRAAERGTIILAHDGHAPPIGRWFPGAGPLAPGRIGRALPPNALDRPPRFEGRNGANDARHAWLEETLGLRGQPIPLMNGSVFVAPQRAAFDRKVRIGAMLLLAALVLAAIVAWAVASRLAAHAVSPLRAITAELQRFGRGDFAKRTVTTRDHTELGDLIEAYNSAVTQVSAAFEERTRVERATRQLLGDAGHQLRTPITVISGYLEILATGDENPAMRQRAYATLAFETQRMRALVERIMTLARLDRPDNGVVPEVLDLTEAVRAAVEEIRVARAGTIELETPSRPLFVRADTTDMHDAIANLLDNAVKYGAGSTVRVTLEGDDDEGAVLRVQDGGPGIPAAERDRIFERFFRGDESGEIDGSGLGLAIARRAMERWGGTVDVENGEPGRTTLRLTLPPPAAEARTPVKLG
jgi:signal transduction histidine kinase